MRDANASELIEKEWHSLGLVQFPALPVADGMYLPKRPQLGDQVSLNQGQQSLDLLVGSVTEESNFFLVYELTEFLNLSEQVRVTQKQLQDTTRHHFRREDSLLVDSIISSYTNWPDPDDPIANRNTLDKIFGDSSFTCHVNEMALRYFAFQICVLFTTYF
jgi:acetylcholinesterase